MEEAIKKMQHLVDECESRIHELQREIKVLEAQREGYRMALRTLMETSRHLGRSLEPAGRSLSENWRRILAFIAEKGSEGAFIDEIYAFIHSQNIEVNRQNIRSQLSSYFNRGFLSRIANSRYAITRHGLEAARLNPNQTLPHFSRESTTFARSPSDLELLPIANQSHKHGRPLDDDEGFN